MVAPMTGNDASGGRKPREITGGMVLAALIAFFGVVMTVNFVMARFAVSTFGGVETENAYQAGLAYSKEEEAAARQASLGWQVEVHVENLGANARQITARVVDEAGRPLSDLQPSIRLVHPTDARKDALLVLVGVGDGRYRGETLAPDGQWDLEIDFTQAGQRVFRTKNRIILR